MTFTEYQTEAQRTGARGQYVKMLNGALGLAGECGECVDLVKKHVFQEHSLDVEHMKEEIGDVLWYCAELATALGVTLDEIAQGNVDKLRRRYPDGFDPERSIHREGATEE